MGVEWDQDTVDFYRRQSGQNKPTSKWGWAAIIAAILACAFLIGYTLPVNRAPTFPNPPTTPPESVNEDDPAFNCLTMGNLTCGPQYQIDNSIRNEACVTWDARYFVHTVCADGTIIDTRP